MWVGVGMKLFEEKGNCCGCTACMSICPRGAIRMEPDAEGFLYPQVDDEKCVNCGLCKTVCVFQNGYEREETEPKQTGYAVKHKKEEVREASRSGGMFTAISDYILESGGTIYGAGYGEHFKVIHKCATTAGERDELRGSKYVQSELGNCFLEIKEKLSAGEKVLFSGTPCQTAALRAYCGEKLRKKLYLVDILCHGVPSDLMWQEFLRLREKELRGKVEQVDFRNKKRFGWQAHHESLVVKGAEYSSKIYASLYGRNMMLRPSCYQCIYTNKCRPSDVTLADFWGHEKAVPGFHEDDKGCSLVLGNTKKGRAWIRKVLEEIEWQEVTGYPYRHSAMRRPVEKPGEREQFFADYRENGFSYVAEKYGDYRPEPYIVIRAKAMLRKLGGEKLYRFLRRLYRGIKD
ncbi:MAG: Coenzyme F420 hydrogenase/dehydrogenase, beta subunit C-terminal domain [Lachnospiraceae bacterium]|nr:Coenzyme F420 hydrogenase/dehydrogenase, beta subunit C-terminal domain [Lachnospiraceae bacterium]